MVRGGSTLQAVDGIPDEDLAASSQSWDGEQHAEFEKEVWSVYDQMVRISIEPYWARFYDFGAGRLPGFLTSSSATLDIGLVASGRDNSEREHRVGSGRFERPLAP
jgi:hypothetical protein